MGRNKIRFSQASKHQDFQGQASNWGNKRPRGIRKHLALLTSSTLALSLCLLLFTGEQAKADRTEIPLALEFSQVASELSEETIAASLPWIEVEVASGDNLSLIFKRAGLGARDVHRIITQSDKPKPLTRLRPGQTIAFQKDEDGKLIGLRYQIDKIRSIIYRRQGDFFKAEEVKKDFDVRYQVANGIIDSSLYLAGNKANLPDKLIMEMANIFGSVMDFVLDVRKGDQFTVIYEELYIDGEKLGTGDILAAEYVNRKNTHQALRFVAESGEADYFSPEGQSMRRAFLRAPLDFTRISSGFNRKRLHPITKKTRPHRGIDYAAPRGTPVYAAGDGFVKASGYSKANGNYVVLQHGQEYASKYLHLHKRAVRKGQKVKQRQIIGWVGSTGLATGPHLHYEFLIGGVHRNPATAVRRLPQARKLKGNELVLFNEQTKGLALQLRTYAAQRVNGSTAIDANAG